MGRNWRSSRRLVSSAERKKSPTRRVGDFGAASRSAAAVSRMFRMSRQLRSASSSMAVQRALFDGTGFSRTHVPLANRKKVVRGLTDRSRYSRENAGTRSSSAGADAAGDEPRAAAKAQASAATAARKAGRRSVMSADVTPGAVPDGSSGLQCERRNGGSRATAMKSPPRASFQILEEFAV